MFEAGTLETVVGPCALKRSDRKTLAISVLPNGTVELVAPVDSPESEVIARVHKRRRWIAKQRHTFNQMNATRPALRYCSGATHRYMGRQYRLKISQGPEVSVRLQGGYFKIISPDTTASTVEKLVDAWMRTHAAAQFSRRITKWSTWCARRDLSAPKLQLRSMPKRWGSAHADGRIALNPKLVRAPAVCIDYVIAHEICHLKYPNHGQHFYKLLNEVCPNWKALKHRLETAEL